MKKFLNLFLLFAVFQGIGTAAVLFMGTKFMQREASFKIPDSISMVVAGNSHPEVAFNDSLVRSLKNISFSGEALNYTYARLRMTIEHNPNIRIAFIEFSEFELLRISDTRIWGDQYVLEHYAQLFPFLEARDHAIMGENNPAGMIKGAVLQVRAVGSRIIHGNYNYNRTLGGYLFLVGKKLDSTNLDGYAHRPDYQLSTSNHSIYTMKAIVDYCYAHDVKVYIIRSPLHERLRKIFRKVPLHQTIKEQFKGVEFLDFGAYPATDQEFADFEHLNYKGARRFSNWFNGLLKKGLLETNDKQKMINDNLGK